MIRVGFVVLTSNNWTGGTNYYKNLLFAISKIKDKKIQPVLFFASNEKLEIINSFKPYGEIVKTKILDQGNFIGILNSFLMRLFNRSFLLRRLFDQNNIQVVSHSRFISNNKNLKTINWITDFQHVHLPRMFSLFERKYRDILFLRFARNSNAVIVSSNDANNDYKKLFPKYRNKPHVLHFVSQPDKAIYKIDNQKSIEKKYNFSGKFFYLPNQLWTHKNHIVVLRAVNVLKEEGKEALILCTGLMKDYRNRAYSDLVMQYIKNNQLNNNVKFLGLIDYKDVQTMMRYCIAIINPSLFEGWSSTVEEAKSIGKSMILSNLNVHKEQNPPSSIYFDPNDEKELAKVLWKKWQEKDEGPDLKLEIIAKTELSRRTEEFGGKYQDIVIGLFAKKYN